MRDKSVNFVEKAENPLNMPEIRPIENFWGILEGLVYQNKRKIEFELIQRLDRSIPRLVDNVRRNGVIEGK
jgi:hypothetical protein